MRVAKNFTKSRATNRAELIHSPREERARHQEEGQPQVSVRLGLSRSF